MPKIFKDEDRNIIREKLIQNGLESLGKKGYKATSIEEIARNTGIAKGTFYNFFSSKEEFFYEIMIYIRDTRRNELKNFFTQIQSFNREEIVDFLCSYVQERNVHHYFSAEEINLIFRRFPRQQKKSNTESIIFAEELLVGNIRIKSNVNFDIVINMINVMAEFAFDREQLSVGSKQETIYFMSKSLTSYIFGEGEKL